MPLRIVIHAGDAISEYSQLRSGRSRAALVGAIWSGVNALVPAIVGAAVFTLASRSLDPGAFGLVALAVTISSLASVLAPAGFGEALVQRPEIDASHLNTVFWLCTGAGALAFAISAVVSLPVANQLNEPLLVTLIPAVSTKAIFELAAVTPMAILTRRMSFHLVAVRTAIASLVAGAVCLGLLWAGWGLWALALSQVAASAANSIGAFAAAKWKPEFRISLSAFNELKRYGVFASGTRVLGVIYPDQLMIGLLLGPFALGIFSFSRRIFQIFNDLIAGALSSVAHSFLSSLQDQEEKVKEAFLIVTYLSSAMAFAVFGGIAATSRELIPTVFGADWAVSLWSVRGFCVIGLISSIGFVQAALINSQGHARWWFFYQLLKQIILLAAVVLVSPQGVSAIVWAMALATIALWPLTLAKSASVVGIPLRRYASRLISPSVSCILMLAAVNATMIFLPFHDAWLRLVILIAVGGAVYVSALILTSYRTIFLVADYIRKRDR